MSSTRRDMFALLPIAAASTALPASSRAAPAASPDAALIAQCEEFIRIDRASQDLGRRSERLMGEPGNELEIEEIHVERMRLVALLPDQDEIGETPAATLAGLRAKAEAQLEYLSRFDDGRFEEGQRLIGGILLDLLRLT